MKENLNKSKDKKIEKYEEFDDNLCDLNLLLRLDLSEFELIQNIIKVVYEYYEFDAELFRKEKLKFEDYTPEEMICIYNQLIFPHYEIIRIVNNLEISNCMIDKYKQKLNKVIKTNNQEYMKKCNDYLEEYLRNKNLNQLISEGKEMLLKIADELSIHLEKILENFPNNGNDQKERGI